MTSDETLRRIRDELPQFLHGHRLSHTYEMEKEALYIASAVCEKDVDRRDVSAAALLHDITKQLSDSEQNKLCDKYGIDRFIYHSPAVLHGKTGAYFAKERYGINEDVFQAIHRHTLGGVDMSLLDKIIFLADFTEGSRAQKNCVALHNYLRENFTGNLLANRRVLNVAVIMSIDSTLSYLISQGQPIEAETVYTRNHILQQLHFYEVYQHGTNEF